MNRIEAIVGPMFAGKSEELIRRITRAKIAGQETVILKPERDDRGPAEKVRTHNGKEIDCRVVSGVRDLKNIVKQGYDVIGIDEVQFLSYQEGFLEAVLGLSEGSRLILAGLDLDYRGKPFDGVGEILAVAEEVAKLTAICEKCGAEATRSERIVESEELYLIGDKGEYEPRCRSCHEEE